MEMLKGKTERMCAREAEQGGLRFSLLGGKQSPVGITTEIPKTAPFWAQLTLEAISK